MVSSYVYLVASLPALLFGAKPPFSFERLMVMCEGLIPDDDLEALRHLPSAVDAGFAYEGRRPALKGWYAFETDLRNELVKIRSSRKKADSAKYLRRERYTEPALTHLALAAHRNPSLLEAEKMLDAERWRVLDETALGHYFDFDVLLAYAVKLLILERWERVRAQDKHKLLAEALPNIQDRS